MIPASDGPGYAQNTALLNSLRTLQSDIAKNDPARAATPPGAGPAQAVSTQDLQAVAADTQHARYSQADVQAAQFFLDHPEALAGAESQAQACTTQPETRPGYRPVKVDAGPNDFSLSLTGPDPDLAVGGTQEQQEVQRDHTVSLAGYAGASYESRLLPGSMRWPSDGEVSKILDGLQPNPPIGADGTDVTHGIYQSQVPNATPDQVFDHWTQHPNEIFNAGGMEIRPPVTTLKDGRYMLETGGTNAPPTWLPVEIKVDPATRSINIKTLDGHVLRGEQTFTFKDDGCGGTRIVQDARFQASSKLTGDMQKFLPISTGQHNAWQNAHRETYEQFNGNPGYQGIGIPYVDPLTQGKALAGQALIQVAKDPGRAADAGIDLTGDLANYGLDLSGRLDAKAADYAGAGAHRTLDWLGLPGGSQVQSAAHDTGQFLSNLQDKTGDVIQAGADKLGNGAKAVVDFINPFG
jgi:hypothetical protein